MKTHVVFGEDTLQRMVDAVEDVRDRLWRATQTLEHFGVPYAVIGGNAVAAWVAQVDRRAVRNTADVDILLRRDDLERAKSALASANFIYEQVAGVDMFLDGPDATPRDAVHVIFAGEKVRREYALPAPDVSDSEQSPLGYRVLTLEALATMKLTSYRRKDQVHIQDFMLVGLLDQSWTKRLPPELASRLQMLLDDPNG